jgi:methionine-rich copper-binding protein CopC
MLVRLGNHRPRSPRASAGGAAERDLYLPHVRGGEGRAGRRTGRSKARERGMKRTSTLWFCLAAALCLCPAFLSAHLKLARSLPAPDASLESSPTALQLWFSEEPVLLMSAMTLTGPTGAIKLEAPRAGGDRSIVAAVGATLEPGAYRIAWKTAGDDGHVISGTVDFSVKARTPPAQ